MSSFSTESTETQSIAGTETQSIASTETQSIASTEIQSIAGTEVQKIMPRQTLRGHVDWVNGVVHLHARRQIITCSTDGSLRLWDLLESCTQIGEDWRDEEDEAGVHSMALSPNSKTIASGCGDGKVRLWDVETRKVIDKWSGHISAVCALCWSGNGKRVLSGSWDGTARVWDVESSQTVLTIETGHLWVWAVIYSPDAAKIATGGDKDAIQIWDAKTGKLLNTLKHDLIVLSLAWTSDGKKLISGSYGQIIIYDPTTLQEIAHLHQEGHSAVEVIILSQNDSLLLCASGYQTVRLWNLDTNLPVGPLLQHADDVKCAALSADEKLVTGCKNGCAYVWDIQAILKEAGLEDLLRPSSDVTAQESSMDADATQAVDGELLADFFGGAVDGANFSGTYANYHTSSSSRPRPLASYFGSVNTLFGRLSSPFRHSRSNTEPQQRPRRALLSRGPRIVEVAAVKDREVIFTAPPPPEKTQQQTQSHAQGSSTTQPPPGANSTTPHPRYAHSLPVRLLGHLVLFLCCASPQHADPNAQPTQQQQGQSTDQAQPQVLSLQTRSTAASTSATPAPATSPPATSPTAPSAASA